LVLPCTSLPLPLPLPLPSPRIGAYRNSGTQSLWSTQRPSRDGARGANGTAISSGSRHLPLHGRCYYQGPSDGMVTRWRLYGRHGRAGGLGVSDESHFGICGGKRKSQMRRRYMRRIESPYYIQYGTVVYAEELRVSMRRI
jgi:hypothetical protein